MHIRTDEFKFEYVYIGHTCMVEADLIGSSKSNINEFGTFSICFRFFSSAKLIVFYSIVTYGLRIWLELLVLKFRRIFQRKILFLSLIHI